MKPIAILSAGIAGLTAANFLKRNNVPFVLYEAGKKIGDLATSFKDADGFSYDFGAHLLPTVWQKQPIAYPVFLKEYEQERQNFEQSTNIENLLSVGRNGEFSHMFMEDAHWRTQKKVRELIERNYKIIGRKTKLNKQLFRTEV